MMEGRNLTKDIIASKLEKIEIEPLAASHVFLDGEMDMTNNVISSYRLSVIVRGNGVISASSGKYYIKAGDIVIVAPDTIHTMHNSDNTFIETYSCRFNIKGLEGLTEYRELFGTRDVMVFNDFLTDYYLGMVTSTFGVVQRNDPSAYYYIKLLIMQALSYLVYNITTASPDRVLIKAKSGDALVMKCADYMRTHQSENITVEDLCRLCECSQSYLYKSFMSILGVSTKQFITRTKIKATEDDLLTTDKSIAEIALTNGYPNTYQFSNIFKKANGMSPSEFRKRRKSR